MRVGLHLRQAIDKVGGLLQFPPLLDVSIFFRNGANDRDNLQSLLELNKILYACHIARAQSVL